MVCFDIRTSSLFHVTQSMVLTSAKPVLYLYLELIWFLVSKAVPTGTTWFQESVCIQNQSVKTKYLLLPEEPEELIPNSVPAQLYHLVLHLTCLVCHGPGFLFRYKKKRPLDPFWSCHTRHIKKMAICLFSNMSCVSTTLTI